MKLNVRQIVVKLIDSNARQQKTASTSLLQLSKSNVSNHMREHEHHRGYLIEKVSVGNTKTDQISFKLY